MGNANSGRYPKLTPEERKRIIGLVADGLPAAEVAREVARSTGFVYRVIQAAGGVARRQDWDPSPARLSASERERIRVGSGSVADSYAGDRSAVGAGDVDDLA